MFQTLLLLQPMTANCASIRQTADHHQWGLIRVAPTLSFAGYQPLIRAYIGKGLRTDLERLDEGSVPRLIASLKRKGVADSLIQLALAKRPSANQLACAIGRCSPPCSITGCGDGNRGLSLVKSPLQKREF